MPTVTLRDPDNKLVLIEGVLFRASYLGSTQITAERGQTSKSARMMQAQEAVGRIKVPLCSLFSCFFSLLTFMLLLHVVWQCVCLWVCAPDIVNIVSSFLESKGPTLRSHWSKICCEEHFEGRCILYRTQNLALISEFLVLLHVVHYVHLWFICNYSCWDFISMLHCYDLYKLIRCVNRAGIDEV